MASLNFPGDPKMFSNNNNNNQDQKIVDNFSQRLGPNEKQERETLSDSNFRKLFFQTKWNKNTRMVFDQALKIYPNIWLFSKLE